MKVIDIKMIDANAIHPYHLVMYAIDCAAAFAFLDRDCLACVYFVFAD